ncbi:hypothetical protein ACIRPT_03400 [Streptomyces sp. NPDC101227]|uniref:hypothetical protein n=1 Tax=Streptomyces sp. NPDC101227 TaxID=3366136 RepID=UPI00382BE7B3
MPVEALGATRAQVLRMMTVEALLSAPAGIALGTLVAAATLIPVSRAVLDRALPAGPPSVLISVVVSALVLILGATLLSTGGRCAPGRRRRSAAGFERARRVLSLGAGSMVRSQLSRWFPHGFPIVLRSLSVALRRRRSSLRRASPRRDRW